MYNERDLAMETRDDHIYEKLGIPEKFSSPFLSIPYPTLSLKTNGSVFNNHQAESPENISFNNPH